MKQTLNRLARLTLSSVAAASTFAFLSHNAHAATIIKHPGAHPNYSFEFEPHLVFDYDDKDYLDDGIGLGAHFAIPFLHQGPISTINNSMAIKFGLDFVFHDDCDEGLSNRTVWGDCSAQSFMIPVALQWNFFITDIITVFGEPGIFMRHYWADWDYSVNGDSDRSDNEVWMYMGFGAKFMFGRTAGLTVRTGWPQTTVGASLLF